MKRRLTKVVLFLLLGAIVNVAVAWTITALPPWPGWPQRPIVLTEIEWPRPVPQHWPSRANSVQERVFGQSAHIYFADVLEETETPDGELWATEQFVTVEEFVINIGTVGWPCLALQWEVWLDDVLPRGGAAGGPHRADGQPVDTWWLGGVDLPFEKFGFSQQGWKRLPVRPIWPGFAINTLFYAAVLWLLFPGPFALRRFIRLKRGLCPACAYPRSESAVCSECGNAIPQHAKLAT